MKVSTESKVLTAFLLGALLLLAAGLMFYRSLSGFRAQMAWVRHTEQVLASLNRLETGLARVEEEVLAQAAGRPSPAAGAVGLRAMADEVERLTADNPAQQVRLAQLRPLLEARLAWAAEALAVSQRQGLEAAVTEVEAEEARQLELRIERLLAELLAEEERLLDERQRQEDEDVVIMQRVILLTGAVVLAAFTFLVILVSRDLLGRRQAEQALREVRDQLEERVVQRTAELEAVNRSLRASDERVRLLVDTMGDTALYMLDAGGRVVSWNAGAQRLLGHRERDVLGQSFELFYPPEAIEAGLPQRLLKEATETGRATDEGWRRCRDGSTFWASSALTALRRPDGSLRGFGKVTRNTTELKRAVDGLRRQEERLRLAVEGAGLGVWEWKITSDEHWWSAAAAGLFGVKPGEATSRADLLQMIHPEDRPRIDAIVRQAIAEHADYAAEFRVVWPDGTVRRLSARGRPYYSEAGEPLRMEGIVADVTEQRQAEELLRASRESLDRAVAAGGVGLWEWEPETGLVVRNDQLRDMLGLPEVPEGPSIERFRSTVHQEDWDELSVTVRRVAQRGGEFSHEFRHVRPDGAVRWLRALGRRLERADGAPVRLHGAMLDVTEQKHVEEALREARDQLEERVRQRTAELEVARSRAESADRLKSAFLATMSHELRTPLNSIIGFTGLLLQGLPGPLNEEQAKQLRLVQKSGRHLLELINDVLDISKIEAGQLEVARQPFDPRQVVEQVLATLHPLADRKAVHLEARLPEQGPPLVSDARRVQQVVLNLVNNAVKFTGTGGRVVVEVEAASAGDGDGSAAAPDASWSVRVRDTGIGIKPDDLDTIFQPFRQVDSGLTRQHEGTGLGLAISRRLARLLGGEITVSSEWGRGSTFTFSVPYGSESNGNGTGRA